MNFGPSSGSSGPARRYGQEAERRLREAARLGFRDAIVPRPAGGATLASIDGLTVVQVATLREAIEAALTARRSADGEAVPAMLG